MSRRSGHIVLLFIVILSLLCFFSSVTAFADDGSGNSKEIVNEGTCGDNVEWSLDSEGVLTIFGNGDMSSYGAGTNFNNLNRAPWYGSRLSINQVIIEEGITCIGDYSFNGCSNLKNVVIPDTVKVIGNGSFQSCSSLASIVVPDGVTRILYNTFNGCGLTEVVLPNSVVSIETNAFRDCSNLECFVIPDGVKSIGLSAFYGCSKLKAIYVPDSVNEIDTRNVGTLPTIRPDLFVYTFPNSYAAKTYTGYNLVYLCEEQESESNKYLGFTTDRIVIAPNNTVTLTDYLKTNIDFTECAVSISGDSSFFYDDGIIASTGEGRGSCTVSSGEYSSTVQLISSAESTSTVSISLNNDSLTMEKGKSALLSYTLAPAEATDDSVIWSCTDSSITTINEGHVEAVGAGTTTITVALESNPEVKDECEITVEAPLKEIITFDGLSSYVLQTGQSRKISYYLYPWDATNTNLSYSSSNPSIISVDKDGVMTACDNGIAQITISSSTISKTVDVTAYTPLKGLTLDKTNITAACGDKIQMTVIYEPANTTERNVVWSSSKESVATVDENGLVSVYSNGIAKITATINGYSATCDIICNAHYWGIEYVVDTNATCTNEGLESIHCMICGERNPDSTRVVEKLAHAYSDWNVTKEVTCTEDGSKEKVCSVCEDKVTESIPAKGHVWNEKYTVDKVPTPNEEGLESIHCSVCDTIKDGSQHRISYETGVLAEGFCGDNLTWSLTYSGTLTIDGIGEMQDCAYDSAPWYEYASAIKNVLISNGVTTIGRGAFEDCTNISSVTIPSSVTQIGNYAFYGCENLESIVLPEGLQTIEDSLFSECSGLKNITIPLSVETIEDGAFWNCTGLQFIYIPDTVVSIGEDVFKDVAGTFYVKKGSAIDLYLLQANKSVQYVCTYGHVWNEDYTIDKQATCTEEGSKSIHCSVCDTTDDTTITVIPKSDHTYGDWMVTKEATCTEDGSKEKVCEVCEDKVTETIPATGHQWKEEYTIDKEATCIEEGSESIHCSVCDAVQEESSRAIEKKEHTYGEWTVTKEVTCTEAGSKEKVCSVCEDKVTEIIPTTGHKWNEEYTIDKEASCTEEGSKSIHCSACNVIDDTTVTVIPKSNHTYGDWNVTKEATCTEDGSKEKVCSVCKDKVTEVIPATGHKWNEEYTIDKEASCTEEGSKSIHCTVCETIDVTTVTEVHALGHDWGEWTVITAATASEEGLETRVCLNDSTHFEERVIPKLAYTGWQKLDGKWYYFDADGIMQTGWQKLSNKWYYFDASGVMKTGWVKLSNKWYYFNSSGVMQTGWQKIGSKQYFFKSSGVMASNEWVKGYYWINKDGTWTYKYKASWKKSGKKWWFTDTSGWYAKNTTIVIDGKKYTFDKSGWMV